MSMHKPIVRAAALSAVLLAAGCGKQPAATPPPATGPAIKVKVVAAEMQRTPEIHELVGTVRVRQSATVAAQLTGRIEAVFVAVGDPVAAGQLLAAVDSRELRARFDQASAERTRIVALLDQQAATRAEFDAAQARYLAAEAALSHGDIVAPFDGVVAQKFVDPGELATPGKPLFLVEDPSGYRLEAEVPERYVDKVKLGVPWHLRIDATGERCVGRAVELVKVSGPSTRSVTVKLDLDCQQPVHSGMFGRAELILGERFALFVPADAVRQRGQLTFVFVALDGRAQLRLVRTGQTYLGAIELLAGVEAGAAVIIAAEGELVDGARVTL